MRQFVPMSDEMLYRAGGPPGRLVPYRAGLDCWHALGEDGIYRFDDAAVGQPLPCPPVQAANDAAATSTALTRAQRA